METIYALLEKYRLTKFYNRFLELGVKDEKDFIDSIDDDTLTSIGLSQVEKTRFEKMQNGIGKLGSVNKSMQNFHVKYRFPKCSEPREISGFWKILMAGPPDTPYEEGTFELYCQFGADYPLKAPTMRFLTPIHHCNVNSVGRICHNIFDRNYSANVTMKAILEAVFGLLIAPEPDDPLDSVVAEEYRANPQAYAKQAEKTTAEAAGESMEAKEQKLVGEDLHKVHRPAHLVCRLSKKLFVKPVSTPYGDDYERKFIERELKKDSKDPFNEKPLRKKDLKPDKYMEEMVKAYRRGEVPLPLSI